MRSKGSRAAPKSVCWRPLTGIDDKKRAAAQGRPLACPQLARCIILRPIASFRLGRPTRHQRGSPAPCWLAGRSSTDAQ